MSDNRPPQLLSVGILLQLSFAIVVAIIVPLLLGIWISRTFNLGPLAIVIVIAIGLIVGAAAVYRLVKDAYAQLGGGK